MSNIISAIFDNRDDAEQAVRWLRSSGVPDDAITVISRQEDLLGATVSGANAPVTDSELSEHASAAEAREHAADAERGAIAGVVIGGGVGALFGLAAYFIPGPGPFITAGALAGSLGLAGGSAVAGAIVGATSGGIAGALAHWGLNEAESHQYAARLEGGGFYVGVDMRKVYVDHRTVMEAFNRYHGDYFNSAA